MQSGASNIIWWKNFRRCCDVGFNPHQPPPEYVSSAFTLQPQGIAIMWPVHVCRPADLVVAVNRFSRFARLANVSNAQFTSPARYGKTRPCLSRLVCRCELDDCSQRVQAANVSVGDSLELSGIQFTPPKRTRHRQDSLVVSDVAV